MFAMLPILDVRELVNPFPVLDHSRFLLTLYSHVLVSPPFSDTGSRTDMTNNEKILGHWVFESQNRHF